MASLNPPPPSYVPGSYAKCRLSALSFLNLFLRGTIFKRQFRGVLKQSYEL